MCDQQRLRPACAYAQSDQSLCLSLNNSMSVKLLTEHHLEFLCLKGGCTGSSESTLVKTSHCWKSHVAAHYNILVFKVRKKAKIGNRCNQVPHMTRDTRTIWKSDKTTRKHHTQERQEVSSFPAVAHKAAMNRHVSRHYNKDKRK